MAYVFDLSNLCFFRPIGIGCRPNSFHNPMKPTKCILENGTHRYITDMKRFNLFWNELKKFHNLKLEVSHDQQSQDLLSEVRNSKSSLFDLENNSTKDMSTIPEESNSQNIVTDFKISLEQNLERENESSVKTDSAVNFEKETNNELNQNNSEIENKENLHVNDEATHRKKENFSESIQNYWNLFYECAKEYIKTKSKTVKEISSIEANNAHQLNEKETNKINMNSLNSEININQDNINPCGIIDNYTEKKNESYHTVDAYKKEDDNIHSNIRIHVKLEEKNIPKENAKEKNKPMRPSLNGSSRCNNSYNESEDHILVTISESKKRKLPFDG